MHKNKFFKLILTLGLAAAFTANAQTTPTTYQVKITNLTPGQAFGAPLIYSHNSIEELFFIGDKACPGITALAEEGDPEVYANDMRSKPKQVLNVFAGWATIAPGASETFTIQASNEFPLITVAGKLTTTNDTFSAVKSINVNKLETEYFGIAYDAGTEKNNENCAYISGVPCGMRGVRDTVGAEGKIQVSQGFKGNAELDLAKYGWTGPVIKVEVTKAP